jgi:ketol-acid reductoisomerase
MVEEGVDPGYAAKLVQYGWETITEALKLGGITTMMDRLPNPAKIAACELADELKRIMEPLYVQHMDDILSGAFSSTMMDDWKNDDVDLLRWREETGKTAFEQTPAGSTEIPEQDYFTNAVLMVAMIKAGVELAFETMVRSGIKEESAYYESHHEVPLIANLIARKKLYEMNRIISDTAEYGTYLFANRCVPLLGDFMKEINASVIGMAYPGTETDNVELIDVNAKIRSHPIEIVGARLRRAMRGMKALR